MIITESESECEMNVNLESAVNNPVVFASWWAGLKISMLKHSPFSNMVQIAINTKIYTRMFLRIA